MASSSGFISIAQLTLHNETLRSVGDQQSVMGVMGSM